MDSTTILIALHVISGYTALAAGFIAVGSSKGKGLHSRTGNLFFWGMLIAGSTALLLSYLKFSPFLFAIAPFTIYLVTGGKLVMIKKSAAVLKKWWKIYSYCGVTIGILMLNFAAYLLATMPTAAIILFVFSFIQIAMSILDVARNPAKNAHNRIFQHINKMGGGLIAASTAFAAVNFTFLPILVAWLAPTVIGSFLIARATSQIKNSRNKPKRGSTSAPIGKYG